MEQKPPSGTGKQAKVIVETVSLLKVHSRDAGFKPTATRRQTSSVMEVL